MDGLIYIYIYKTEAFEASTTFHVSTIYIYIYIYNILKKRNKVSTTFKKKKQTLKTIKPKKKKKKRNTNNPILPML